MRNKLKPYFSVKLFVAYVIIALVYGFFFLPDGDAFGYSLFCFYFLSPILASFSAFHLVVRKNWKIAAIALLLYAVANNMMQILVFHNQFHISWIHICVVLVPGVICMLFGRLSQRSNSDLRASVRAWLSCFWPFLVCIAVAIAYQPSLISASTEEYTACGLLFFQSLSPLLIFGGSLWFAMQQDWGMCCASTVFTTIITLFAARIVFSLSLFLTLIAFLAALLGILAGKLLVYRNSRQKAKAGCKDTKL
jgi:hypothetical protein